MRAVDDLTPIFLSPRRRRASVALSAWPEIARAPNNKRDEQEAMTCGLGPRTAAAVECRVQRANARRSSTPSREAHAGCAHQAFSRASGQAIGREYGQSVSSAPPPAAWPARQQNAAAIMAIAHLTAPKANLVDPRCDDMTREAELARIAEAGHIGAGQLF